MPPARRLRPVAPMTLSEITEITGRSRISIWRYRRAGMFPEPIGRRGKSLIWDGRAVRRWKMTGR
ncbi:MAG: hypothetical protein DHS20C03_20800 [Minwuia thermotolerans]|nr:MAG: hypothetical protein DHS20C03_20800 [Minwuia thermotolerans]